MLPSSSNPHITLIGAGPGDPDLISVKGLKALRRAQVVFYDALVHPDLVEEAEHALKVYVGKRCGRHSVRQEDINHLLVSYARQYGAVVRLKGGDPFVFGRGQEEIDYARANGVTTDVIPGISSAIAAPGLAGIPLTHRGVAESFWVITGTTRKHELSRDLELAAQSSATVVILMGTRKLPAITEVFLRYRPASESVALLEKGSLPDSRIITGQLQDICEKAEAGQFAAPGIIVIGPVTALALEPLKADLK
ncbi:uroporphyrinogen-III C-methyltransferase [Flavilitoribacter nigricans]|uniref:uroporphyrinogen-III C-methyltransferase n=1 Tax=Flavilitoribacter nigricans (strain ATCC 23147 / DSM 23189 / NBRC 102662 / NCIMB 1420 / SS-2) TaxID=1122177 RepID=A0A2D0N5S8_FLAN2|nr:uroporphyrinogen-III C-methyltransferase [Flavilitoribacter nigricans]PHN03861.1 uroporphyrinogen-III C-methyltransferase [Flavilitoribacter nigricans DSM 23189 = NBRC 102662]